MMRTDSLTPSVGDLQVVVPVGVVEAQLRATNDGVATVGEGAGEPLREPGCVPPEPPCFIVDAYVVDTEHAARVEVVHGDGRLGGVCGIAVRLVVNAIPLGDPDDGDQVRKVRMIGAGAMDQKAFAFEPFDDGGAVHDYAGIF